MGDKYHFKPLPFPPLWFAMAYYIFWEAMTFSEMYSIVCFNGYLMAAANIARWTIWIYACSEVFRQTDKKRVVLYVLLMILLSYSAFTPYGMFGTMMVAVSGRPVRKLLPCWFMSQFIVIAISWAGTLNGMAEYVIRDTGGRNMGATWNTDGSALGLFALIAYVAYRQKLRLFEYPILGYICWYMFKLYKARNNMISVIMLLVFSLGYTLYEDYLNDGKIKQTLSRILGFLRKYIFDYVFIYGAVLFAAVFACRKPILDNADKIPNALRTLYDRLSMTDRAFSENSIRLFGVRIADENPNLMSDTFYFLDAGYPRILLYGGVIIFVIFMTMTVFLQKKAARNRYWAIYIVMIVLAWYSEIDYHYMHYYYCAIPVLAFADWTVNKEEVSLSS